MGAGGASASRQAEASAAQLWRGQAALHGDCAGKRQPVPFCFLFAAAGLPCMPAVVGSPAMADRLSCGVSVCANLLKKLFQDLLHVAHAAGRSRNKTLSRDGSRRKDLHSAGACRLFCLLCGLQPLLCFSQAKPATVEISRTRASLPFNKELAGYVLWSMCGMCIFCHAYADRPR